MLAICAGRHACRSYSRLLQLEADVPGQVAMTTCCGGGTLHCREADDAHALGEDEDDGEDGHLRGKATFSQGEGVVPSSPRARPGLPTFCLCRRAQLPTLGHAGRALHAVYPIYVGQHSLKKLTWKMAPAMTARRCAAAAASGSQPSSAAGSASFEPMRSLRDDSTTMLCLCMTGDKLTNAFHLGKQRLRSPA